VSAREAAMEHQVVSRGEWIEARRALLREEKALTRQLDKLAAKRRALPWVKIEKSYTFDGPNGPETLEDLFEGRSQLIVYHFMFGPDWAEGCEGCSFWADNFNGTIEHINQRDASMVAISRAPIERLEAFRKRMGWTFKWVSSFRSDFNFDFNTSYPKGPGEKFYNFEMRPYGGEEAHGVSTFYRNEAGDIFHTYSCYARGVDILNGAYQTMDLLPKGRGEEGLSDPSGWLRLRDRYCCG
jgi:predicted dithiol-disulfide oxidoreductase (DUF899 family)